MSGVSFHPPTHPQFLPLATVQQAATMMEAGLYAVGGRRRSDSLQKVRKDIFHLCPDRLPDCLWVSLDIRRLFWCLRPRREKGWKNFERRDKIWFVQQLPNPSNTPLGPPPTLPVTPPPCPQTAPCANLTASVQAAGHGYGPPVSPHFCGDGSLEIVADGDIYDCWLMIMITLILL